MDETMNDPGGFLLPSLPSPAPSHASSSSTTSNLPHPRAKPLRPGSQKEDAARRFLEARLLHISRRYTKKFQPKEDQEGGENVSGYESMSEAAKDLSEIVDVVWLSGTPSLQVPYLLNIAGQVNNYLPSFPSSPKATFGLLRKLDHAFSSLLGGEDSITGEILPGFEGDKRAGFSKTDMVRCKGLIEATRVIAVDVMGAEPEVATNVYESEADTDVEMESAWDMEEDMHVARVYEQTIVKLGELLESSAPFQAAVPNTFQC